MKALLRGGGGAQVGQEVQLTEDENKQGVFQGEAGDRSKDRRFFGRSKLQRLTRICPPATAICRRPLTPSSRGRQLDHIFRVLFFFDGAATRAPFTPEEGEGGRLGNEGHCAECVMDADSRCGQVSQPKMEYICVFMKRAVTEKDTTDC